MEAGDAASGEPVDLGPQRLARRKLVALCPSLSAPPLGRDHTGVQAKRMQPAEEPGVLHLDAMVHDHLQPSFAGLLGGLVVDDAQLQHNVARNLVRKTA